MGVGYGSLHSLHSDGWAVVFQYAEQPMEGPHGQYAHLSVQNDVPYAVAGLYAQRVPNGLGERGLPLSRYRGFQHASPFALTELRIALLIAIE